MTIEEYKNIRNAGKDLANKILDFKKGNREDTIYAGKLLGFWDGKAMVFDSDDESDVLMDLTFLKKIEFSVTFRLPDLNEKVNLIRQTCLY